MSILIVSYDNSKPDSDKLTQVELDTLAINTIYDKVVIPMSNLADVDDDLFKLTKADLVLKNLNFIGFDEVNFNRAYELLIDACNKHNSLKPYKAKLDKAFKTDPRYKAPNPA